jgi:hypothetical protein
MRAGAVAILAGETQRVLTEYPNTPIPPESVAVAVVKNVVDQATGASEAILAGVSPERFDAMVKATGNPPGWADLLDQWRRGLIGDADLEHGVRQGLLKDEWLPFVRNLRHVPLPATTYLQGAVQGHMDLGEAKAKADGLGLTDADAQLVYEIDGNPLGPQEMLHLWNRGEMTEAEVDQGFRESRYKNKYLAAFKALRRYYPPARSITTLISHGGLTPEEGQHYFEAAGLDATLARAYVVSAQHVKTASHKELAVGTVKSLYADRVIDRTAAVTDLAKVGYGGAEANLILDLADAQAKQRIRNQAVNRIHTLYLRHRLTPDVVRADLTKIGIFPDHITDLLAVWQLELDTPTKQLSIGQLHSLYKKNLMSHTDFVGHAVGLGYTAGDAELLSQLDHPLPAP